MLIMDVVLPVMGGPELAERIPKVRPAMRILYMSGYTDDEMLCRKGLQENSAFLQEPFTPHQLLQKARSTSGPIPAREIA